MSLIANEYFYNKSEVDHLIEDAGPKVIQRCSLVAFVVITTVALALLFSQHSSFSASYAYVSHEGLIYTQIYGIAAGSAFFTFIISSCHRSQKIKNFRECVLNKNSELLNKFRHLFFKSGFNYGKSLDDLTNSSSFFKKYIASRVAALGISIFSAIQLAQDVQHVLGHSINGTVSCITRWQSPLKYPANYRNVALVAGEIFTHLLGASFGTIIGIFSPKKAREWFLPSDQSSMEQRSENMTREEAGTLYGMFNVVDKIFNDNNLKYAISAGTVLGKERHGGIIPWDDDVDLFMMETDEKAFCGLENKLAAHDLAIISCRIGYKIYYTKGRDIKEGNLEYKYPFIDVAMAQERDGKIVYRDEHSRQTYAGEYYTREEWDSMERVEFGPIQVNGLKDGLPFVKRCYGENSMEYGFTLLNHRTFNIEFPKKYLLHKNHRTHLGQLKCKPIEYDEEAFKKFKL